MSLKFELHPERLATTDEHGHRVYLYPEDVRGKWRQRRTWWFFCLIFFYMVLPWLHYQGNQLVLINLPARKLHFFGHLFYASDAPLLFFIFGIAIAVIALLTATFGRVWCGWACPQTVFIDAIFSRIDRWVEGSARKREELDRAPWDLKKALIKAVKWTLYILVALHISHSFLGYFVGTYELLYISTQSPTQNLTLFFLMVGLTLLTLFDFGWFREQFCIIACPYGRLQSVLLDSDSWVVGYNSKRGEPRRSPQISTSAEGDCINCYHCVRVCPTGVDIRRGLQLECIHCTQCIDACDEIMNKIGKPPGLISYTNENLLKEKQSKKIRPRTLIYSIVIVVMLAGLINGIQKTQDQRFQLIRSGRGDYERIQDPQGEKILNHFKLIVDSHQTDNISISCDKIPCPQITLSPHPFPIRPGHNQMQLFLKFPLEMLQQGRGKAILNLKSSQSGKITTMEVPLVGPLN